MSMTGISGLTTRRGAIKTLATAAGFVAVSLLAPDATGQQRRTAHLDLSPDAPRTPGVAASVRCPLDMTVRVETPQYVALLDVLQDRTPVLPDEVFPRPRPVDAIIRIQSKEGVGSRLTPQAPDPDYRLPTQVRFHQRFADSRVDMYMHYPHKQKFQSAHLEEIRALGTSMIGQIRGLASQLCAPGATDGTITVRADHPRLQPILANVEQLYRRSLPPAQVSALK
jgi:hypothetical protein